MSDNFEYIDVDDDDYFDAPKALRDHVRKLQERLTDREQKLTEVQSKLSNRSASDVLADKGFKNPKRVARDLLADKVDPSDERAVTKWLEENGDDYAKAEVQPSSDAAPAGEGGENTQDDGTAEIRSGHEQMQRTTTGAPPAGHDKYQAAFNEIDPSWDAERVRQHLVGKGL